MNSLGGREQLLAILGIENREDVELDIVVDNAKLPALSHTVAAHIRRTNRLTRVSSDTNFRPCRWDSSSNLMAEDKTRSFQSMPNMMMAAGMRRNLSASGAKNCRWESGPSVPQRRQKNTGILQHKDSLSCFANPQQKSTTASGNAVFSTNRPAPKSSSRGGLEDRMASLGLSLPSRIGLEEKLARLRDPGQSAASVGPQRPSRRGSTEQDGFPEAVTGLQRPRRRGSGDEKASPHAMGLSRPSRRESMDEEALENIAREMAASKQQGVGVMGLALPSRRASVENKASSLGLSRPSRRESLDDPVTLQDASLLQAIAEAEQMASQAKESPVSVKNFDSVQTNKAQNLNERDLLNFCLSSIPTNQGKSPLHSVLSQQTMTRSRAPATAKPTNNPFLNLNTMSANRPKANPILGAAPIKPSTGSKNPFLDML